MYNQLLPVQQGDSAFRRDAAANKPLLTPPSTMFEQMVALGSNFIPSTSPVQTGMKPKIGLYVWKAFDVDDHKMVYGGRITSCDRCDKTGKRIWRVLYGDGDIEDYMDAEIATVFKNMLTLPRPDSETVEEVITANLITSANVFKPITDGFQTDEDEFVQQLMCDAAHLIHFDKVDPNDMPDDLIGWEVLGTLPFGAPARAFAVCAQITSAMTMAEVGKTLVADIKIPKKLKTAFASENGPLIKEAVKIELEQLTTTETWRIVKQDSMPLGTKPITGAMVLVAKRRLDGTLRKIKARYVAHGFKQKWGIDYYQTYAPTVLKPTMRIFLAWAMYHKHEIHQ